MVQSHSHSLLRVLLVNIPSYIICLNPKMTRFKNLQQSSNNIYLLNTVIIFATQATEIKWSASNRSAESTESSSATERAKMESYVLNPLEEHRKRLVKFAQHLFRREVGGGFRMGNTCTRMADSCQCMAKPLQYCKVISLQVKYKLKMIY